MALTKISTDGVKDDAITKTKIPANQIEASELADNAVDTNAIADQAVALSKLPHGTSSNNGKFLRANNGADPTFETVDLVSDTTPQLGGQLQSNGQHINLEDSNKLKLGSDGDTELFHNNIDAYIQNHTGDLNIENVGTNSDDITLKAKDNVSIRVQSNESAIECFGDGAVELYHDNTKRFSTTNSGFTVKEGNTTRLSFEYSNSLAFITANAGNEIKVSSGNGDANGIEFWDYTGVNKRCQIDGHGIKFNADTAQANALNDYEEGTWTPTGSGFTVSSVYSARYTKIGRLVHVSTYFQVATGSGTSVQPEVLGLPFAAYGGNAYSYGSGRVGSAGGNTLSQNNIVWQVQSGQSKAKLYVNDGGVNESMISGQHMIFSVVYEAA